MSVPIEKREGKFWNGTVRNCETYSLQACSISLKSLSFESIDVFIIHLIAIKIISGVID